MTAALRTVVYCRISRDSEGEVLGIARQEQDCRELAKRLGLKVLRVMPENDISASTRSKRRRPLLVAKGDRLARDTFDQLAVRKTAQREGWTVLAVDGSADDSTDLTTAMSTVSAVFAQLEVAKIRQRTREGMAAKRDQGIRLGRPVTLADEVRERIASERQAGATLQTIADGLNADEIPTSHAATHPGAIWRPSSVAAVLRSLEHDEYAEAARRSCEGLETLVQR